MTRSDNNEACLTPTTEEHYGILEWNTERQIFLPLITNRHYFTNTSIFSRIWPGAFLIQKFLWFLVSCLMLIMVLLPQLIREQAMRWVQSHSYFYRSLTLTQQKTPAVGPTSTILWTTVRGTKLSPFSDSIDSFGIKPSRWSRRLLTGTGSRKYGSS